jgi:hypothetical protein
MAPVAREEMSVTQDEYELLTKIEQGTAVFRQEVGVGIDPAFSKIFDGLMALRSQGLIRLPDGRIMRDRAGRVMMAGPCDLTEAGRRALEQDRRLGPRR